MNVKAIRWVGVRTERLVAMRAFAVEVLGLRPVTDSPTFVEAMAMNGDRLELFDPAGRTPPWQFASNEVVAGFLVDDLDAAREELGRTAGVELLGALQRSDSGYAWQHFRAPDGHVYELVFDPTAG